MSDQDRLTPFQAAETAYAATTRIFSSDDLAGGLTSAALHRTALRSAVEAALEAELRPRGIIK